MYIVRNKEDQIYFYYVLYIKFILYTNLCVIRIIFSKIKLSKETTTHIALFDHSFQLRPRIRSKVVVTYLRNSYRVSLASFVPFRRI